MVHMTFLINFSCHIQLIIAKVIGKNEVLVASQKASFFLYDDFVQRPGT